MLFVGVSAVIGCGGSVMLLAGGVWTLSLTGSSSLAALAAPAFYLPTLLGPLIGSLADRLPRKPLLIWTCLITALVLLSLLAVRSSDQLWLIYLVMAAYGVSFVLVDVGDSALLPAALPSAGLGLVNGLRTSAQEGMKLIAPLLGAALFAWQGGYPVAVLAAALLLVAAGLYWAIRIRPPAGGSLSRPPADGMSDATIEPERRTVRVRDGLRYLWRHPVLRPVILLGGSTIALSGVSTAAVYEAVTTGLHRPPEFMGVLASAQGAGSLLGGLIVGRLLTGRGEGVTGGVGAVLVAAGATAWFVPWWPVTLLGSLLVGLGLPWTLVAAMTAVQTRTPSDLLGRVAGTANTVLFAPTALATPIGAALVLIDRRLPLFIVVVVALTTGVSTLIRMRHVGPVADPEPSSAVPDPHPVGTARGAEPDRSGLSGS
ncbi:MFS transporter [Plantactinospora sp. GCM10030261]|uniref:MFS transporter n=1 Tax=Plantactinospora sp. GCM10030261 TaxID=3273420 RepID=UPI003620B209